MLWTKLIVSVVLLATTLAAALSMLTLMGRKERTMSAGALKSVHRIAGWFTVVLALVNGYLGAKYVAMVGDGMAIRAALHGLIALGLLSALLIKVLIVKRFKQYLSMAPALGLIVFALMLVTIATSTGFFVVSALWGPGSAPELDDFVELVAPDGRGSGGAAPDETAVSGTAVSEEAAATEAIARGRLIYRAHCAGCHPTDPARNGYGPTLPGLFEKEAMAAGGPVSEETVRAQILAPAGTMPAFEGRLDEGEMDDLLAYMKTL